MTYFLDLSALKQTLYLVSVLLNYLYGPMVQIRGHFLFQHNISLNNHIDIKNTSTQIQLAWHLPHRHRQNFPLHIRRQPQQLV